MEKKEKYKNIRAFVVLLAALITWVINMKSGRGLMYALIVELAVIIIFYIISSIAISLFDKIANMEKKIIYEDTDAEEDEAGDETQDSEN